MKKLASLFLLFITINVYAQIHVYPIQTVQNVNRGMVYSLPQTSLSITIQTLTTTKTPGPYARYAKAYFGTDDADIIRYKSKYTEINNIDIKTMGIPDPEKTFLVKTGSRSIQNLIQTNKQGILIGVNTSVSPLCNSHKEHRKCDQKFSCKKCNVTDKNTAFDKSSLGEKFFFADSIEKAADFVASEIYDIRESIYYLQSGSSDYAPSDEGSLKTMIQELKERERTLMALFVGKTTHEMEEKTFSIKPEEETGKSILCYFSTQKGILEQEEEMATPIYISVEANRRTYPQVEKNKSPEYQKSLIYCIPGTAYIELTYNTTSLYKTSFPVAQFGTYMTLSPKLLNKPFLSFFGEKEDVHIIFDPTTGAIRSLYK